MIECQAGNLTHGGSCIVHHDGKVGFVSGAIPGETVQIEIDRMLSKRFFGHVVGVSEPSAHRISPPGSRQLEGMELAYMSDRHRRTLMADVVRDALTRVGGREFGQAHAGLDISVATPGDIIGVADVADHWRLRLEVTLNGEGVACMYREGTHDLVELEDIPFVVDAISRRAVIGPGALSDVAEPGQRVRIVSADNGVFALSPHGCFVCEDGRWQPSEETHGVYHVATDAYRVALNGFWQAHRVGAHVLRSAVMRGVKLGGSPSRIWELYSGAGLFSVPLARVSDSLVTWEGSEQATLDAAGNLAANLGEGHGVVLHQPQSIALKSFALFAASQAQAPTTIVLDPPRVGAGAKLMDSLGACGAQTVVYVACDIASLARDAAALWKHGYRITQLICIDLFPKTHHLECVATLIKER